MYEQKGRRDYPVTPNGPQGGALRYPERLHPTTVDIGPDPLPQKALGTFTGGLSRQKESSAPAIAVAFLVMSMETLLRHIVKEAVFQEASINRYC